MAYDTRLAKRVRTAFGSGSRMIETAMEHEVSFVYRGHLTCAIVGDDLHVRVGPAGYKPALERTGTRPAQREGRPWKDMVIVDIAGIRTRVQLARWVREGMTYVRTLPVKQA